MSVDPEVPGAPPDEVEPGGPPLISRRSLALGGAAAAAALVGCSSTGSGPRRAVPLPPLEHVDPVVRVRMAQGPIDGLNGWVDVKDHGAVGDGVADDTQAIQQAIDACAVAGDPARVTRRATQALYLSPGYYKVTAPLRITSVQGFYMTGAGVQTSSFLPVAAKPFDSVLDINGCAEGWFGNFSVLSGGQVCNVDKVIAYRWDKDTAARSSTGCTFSNIVIREVTFRIGFAIGVDNHLQVDGTGFYNCGVSGSYQGSGDKWQYGFKFGNGVSGNNLDHSLFNSGAGHCKYGMWFGGANGWVFGGQPTDNEIDVHVETPSVFSFQGLRSEGAKRFLTTGSGSAGGLIAVRDLLFVANGMDSDGYWIDSAQGGGLTLENVSTYNVAAGTVAKIRASGKAQVVVINVLQPTPLAEGLVASNGAKFVVVAYSQSDSSGQTVASSQFVTRP